MYVRNDMLRFIFFLCGEIFGNIDEQTVVLETLTSVQWWIQDFPERGIKPTGDDNVLYGIFLAKYCIKMKQIGLRRVCFPRTL